MEYLRLPKQILETITHEGFNKKAYKKQLNFLRKLQILETRGQVHKEHIREIGICAVRTSSHSIIVGSTFGSFSRENRFVRDIIII